MSNGAAAEKIERARRYALNSQLDHLSKDNISDLLDAAKQASTASTAEEKLAAVSDALAALAVHEARQAVRYPDHIKDAIDLHVEELHTGQHSDLPQTRGEMIYTLMLRPWPWLAVSVAVFSPHLPNIIQVAGAVFGGK